MSETETNTALALLGERAVTAADVYAKDGGVDAILADIKRLVAETPTDISTPKGRIAVKSLAHKVARTKTALLEMGLGLTEEARKRIAAVNQDKKRIETELDALKAEVLADVTAWDEAEDARVKGHEKALDTLARFADPAVGKLSPDDIENQIAVAKEFAAGRDWQIDFRKRASDLCAKVIDTLNTYLTNARHRVAEEELARQRAAETAEAERIRLVEEQAARDAEIARQAADKARQEAAQEAARVALEVQQAAAEARLQLEKAEAARVRMHGDRIAYIVRCGAVPVGMSSSALEARMAVVRELGNYEWEEFAERASAVRVDALAALNIALKSAQERDDEERGAQQTKWQEEERARAQKELNEKIAAENAAAKARADNVAHRRSINREIVADMVRAMSDVHTGTADEAGKIAEVLVKEIVTNKVRHVSIRY